jgi:hypothetical protein
MGIARVTASYGHSNLNKLKKLVEKRLELIYHSEDKIDYTKGLQTKIKKAVAKKMVKKIGGEWDIYAIERITHLEAIKYTIKSNDNTFYYFKVIPHVFGAKNDYKYHIDLVTVF